MHVHNVYWQVCYRIVGNFHGCKLLRRRTRGSRRYFYGSYFCDKTLHSAVTTGLLKILAGFIFAVVGSSGKTAKVYRYMVLGIPSQHQNVLIYRQQIPIKNSFVSSFWSLWQTIRVKTGNRQAGKTARLPIKTDENNNSYFNNYWSYLHGDPCIHLRCQLFIYIYTMSLRLKLQHNGVARGTLYHMEASNFPVNSIFDAEELNAPIFFLVRLHILSHC